MRTVELRPPEPLDGQPLLMGIVLKEDCPESAAGAHMAGLFTHEHDCPVQNVVMAAAGYTRWKE